MTRLERENFERRCAEERRQKVNECIAWFGEERRRQDRRRTAFVNNWMARFDRARGIA